MKNLVQLIKLPKVNDDCFLCYAESEKHIPFKIKRIYFIGKPKSGLDRGKHAHLKNTQVLFCIQGSVKIILNDGKKRKKVTLNTPETGILLKNMVWHEMKDMTEKTILLVLASEFHKESDYVRNYDEFLKLVKNK